MSGYRFCRTDDMPLLVDALNRCWSPHFPGEPPITLAAFKRSIRDLQIWCSSCMVALSGADPIAVLIGAKRRSGTLVHRIAVHPDHLRRGHGRHLLASLGSKLAILGPPRITAEVPETLGPARALFDASGFAQESLLTDYVREAGNGIPWNDPGGLVFPVTVDDLVANGLLNDRQVQPCWNRAVETLVAGKDEITGLAAGSDEAIEASILYRRRGADTEVLFLRSFVPDGARWLSQLLSRLDGRAWFPRVHPSEIPHDLDALGFRAAGRHVVYAATARGD